MVRFCSRFHTTTYAIGQFSMLTESKSQLDIGGRCWACSRYRKKENNIFINLIFPMIKLRLLTHKGCANLLGGWRQGYDLRHGQAHLRTQVLMIDFQLFFPRLYLWFKTKIKLEFLMRIYVTIWISNIQIGQIRLSLLQTFLWDPHAQPSSGARCHGWCGRWRLWSHVGYKM